MSEVEADGEVFSFYPNPNGVRSEALGICRGLLKILVQMLAAFFYRLVPGLVQKSALIPVGISADQSAYTSVQDFARFFAY